MLSSDQLKAALERCAETPGFKTFERCAFEQLACSSNMLVALLSELTPLAIIRGEVVKPTFDYKAEGLKLFPAPQGNARREGWNAHFEDKARNDCPFPLNRRDLLQGYQQGWDEAEEFDPL